MAERLFVKEIASDTRARAIFGDKYLPQIARHGELFVVDGILYCFADINAENIGRWVPLSKKQEILKFTQSELSAIWTIPLTETLNDIIIVIYDDRGLVYNGNFVVNNDASSIAVSFDEPISGHCFIFADGNKDLIVDSLSLSNNSLNIYPNPTNPTEYLLEINTKTFKIDETGKVWIYGDTEISGTATINDIIATTSTIGDLTVTDNITSTGSATFSNIFIETGSATDFSVDNVIVNNNLSVNGTLTFTGTSTQINTTELTVSDNIITLNSGTVGTPILNAGIEVERGDEPTVSLQWDEQNDYWSITNDGTNFYKIPTIGTLNDGLNADTLDGYHFSDLDSRFVNVSGDTIVGDLVVEGNVTFGTDLTNSNVTFFSDAIFNGIMSINSNLNVSGDTIYSSGMITLSQNFDESLNPLNDVKIIVDRGTTSNPNIRWNELLKCWELTNDGTNYFRIALTSPTIRDTDINLAGNLTVSGNTILGNTVGTVPADTVTINAIVTQNGNSTINGDVQINGDLSVRDNVYLGTDTSNVVVSGSFYHTGNSVIDGNLTVSKETRTQDLVVSDGVTIGSNADTLLTINSSSNVMAPIRSSSTIYGRTILPTNVISESKTLSLLEEIILCDASATPLIITLPDLVNDSYIGYVFVIKKIDSSLNQITVVSSQKIDGYESVVVESANEKFTVCSAKIGTEYTWFII